MGKSIEAAAGGRNRNEDTEGLHHLLQVVDFIIPAGMSVHHHRMHQCETGSTRTHHHGEVVTMMQHAIESECTEMGQHKQ